MAALVYGKRDLLLSLFERGRGREGERLSVRQFGLQNFEISPLAFSFLCPPCFLLLLLLLHARFSLPTGLQGKIIKVQNIRPHPRSTNSHSSSSARTSSSPSASRTRNIMGG